MWSAAVFEPALPGRSAICNGFSGAGRAVVDEHAQRVEPEPPFEWGPGVFSFSECDPTKVASTSLTNGCPASMPWSGA